MTLAVVGGLSSRKAHFSACEVVVDDDHAHQTERGMAFRIRIKSSRHIADQSLRPVICDSFRRRVFR
ncbi:hypothetical protein ACYZUC_05625 [Pseudomonas sp. GT1P32]